MKPTDKKSYFFVLICVFLLSLTGPALSQQSAPVQHEEKSRVQKWQEDIDEMASELPKRHKNLFFQLTKSTFKQEIQNLKKDLPDLSDEEIIWRLSCIVASAGDSHTSLRYQTKIAFPFTLYWFQKGIYAINTVPEYKHILNRRLVKINNKPIEKVVETLKKGISHENEAQIKSSAPYFIAMAEYLYGAHVIEEKDKANFTFEMEKGKPFDVHMEAISLKTKPEWIVSNENEENLPLYRQNRDKPYSFTYLKNEKTIYVLYNSCRMMKGKLFKDFVMEVFEQVDNNPVEQFVVDLRNNGGGNSMIFYPMLKELKEREKLNQKDNLFVIVGRRTFSSAILNALQMKNQTNATLIGEPTGGKPNHFGEIKYFQLSNSRLHISYSTKYFSFSQQDTDSIYPDITVEISIEDYLSKKDPVLEKILKR
ncbi:MAG: peptidase S41 [Candidatus Aminicenantes bacterium]|nr:peptidase S41 [Candidatus Aminicenantes bacterium]